MQQVDCFQVVIEGDRADYQSYDYKEYDVYDYGDDEEETKDTIDQSDFNERMELQESLNRYMTQQANTTTTEAPLAVII